MYCEYTYYKHQFMYYFAHVCNTGMQPASYYDIYIYLLLLRNKDVFLYNIHKTLLYSEREAILSLWP